MIVCELCFTTFFSSEHVSRLTDRELVVDTVPLWASVIRVSILLQLGKDNQPATQQTSIPRGNNRHMII